MGLKDKASKIDFASLPGIAVGSNESQPNAAGPRPKTAPGLMMAHAADQRSEILRQNDELKAQVTELSVLAARADELQDELSAWDGAKPTRLIDPRLIVRSRWANRDPRHFASQDFESLKAEIAHAGGNVQPVKVRPCGNAEGGQQTYELVYGHRRLEACQQLGLQVLALVENLGDAALFVEMDRENRSRKDLSAWEQGVMYQRALQEGLFSSNRKLADAVGADLSNVGKALSLATLPQELVAAFESPLDLQYRWAKPLKEAWEADPAVSRVRAKELAETVPRLRAKEVFERLVGGPGQGGGTVPPPPVHEIVLEGRRVASVSTGPRGSTLVTIVAGLVPEKRLPDLGRLIEQFLAAPKGRSR